MIELIFSALITILPDYLYRRHKQGKRIGIEITLFNVWYELRWGLTACAILAISLLTVIFYFHPTTNTVSAAYRTVSILSERPGRVEVVYVPNNGVVKAGDPLFKLDTSQQEAAAETALRRLDEIDAAMAVSASDLQAALSRVQAAEAEAEQAADDLQRREAIANRNASIVSEQELASLRSAVEAAQAARDSAQAAAEGARLRRDQLLPAQRASAQAMLAEAQNVIATSTVRAYVDGSVTQFLLKPGDIVNPILRPAGILVPRVTGEGRFAASFAQISSSVLREGMLVEITCATKPLTVIPMIIASKQEAIAAGQFRPGDALVDLQDRRRPGTVTVFLEPVFEGHTAGVQPGSSCVGVAYTSRAAEIRDGEITGFAAFIASIVDGMGIANALVMRAQSILLPVRALVFS
jgi:multidrug resistance efflux pump